MHFWLTWSKVFQYVNYDWFLCRCIFAVFFLFFFYCSGWNWNRFSFITSYPLFPVFLCKKDLFPVCLLLLDFHLSPQTLLFIQYLSYSNVFHCLEQFVILFISLCVMVFYFFPFLFFEHLLNPLASGFLPLASQLSLLMFGLIWLRPLTISTVRLWALWPTLKLVDFPVVDVSTSNQNMPSGVLISPAWSIYLIQIVNIKTWDSHSHMHHSRNTRCTVWQLMLDAFSDANQALWHLCPDTVRIPYSFWLSTTSVLPWMHDARWLSVPLY